MSFTDAKKDNKAELAISLFTRAMQEHRGGDRRNPPRTSVVWPAFESVEVAERELARIEFYLGRHSASIRYAVVNDSKTGFETLGRQALSSTLRDLARQSDSLVLVWSYRGFRALPYEALHRSRVIDPEFHDKCEALTSARLMRWDYTTGEETRILRDLSARRISAFRSWAEGPAAVFGTGPGLDLFDSRDLGKYRTRVGCNSMVLSDEVLNRTRPNVLCFGDPVFHFGFSDQAKAFRNGLLAYVEQADPWIFMPLDFGGWVDELTRENERVVPLNMKRRGPFNVPTEENVYLRRTGNVMTEIMVPVAASVGSEISIFGCDGRPPSADGFWSYGKGVHDDRSYDTAVSAHPSFFRDRRYLRYYNEHCHNLERLLAQLEGQGHSIVNRSPSEIPALSARSETHVQNSLAQTQLDLSRIGQANEVVR